MASASPSAEAPSSPMRLERRSSEINALSWAPRPCARPMAPSHLVRVRVKVRVRARVRVKVRARVKVRVSPNPKP